MLRKLTNRLYFLSPCFSKWNASLIYWSDWRAVQQILITRPSPAHPLVHFLSCPSLIFNAKLKDQSECWEIICWFVSGNFLIILRQMHFATLNVKLLRHKFCQAKLDFLCNYISGIRVQTCAAPKLMSFQYRGPLSLYKEGGKEYGSFAVSSKGMITKPRSYFVSLVHSNIDVDTEIRVSENEGKHSSTWCWASMVYSHNTFQRELSSKVWT